ncbi:MAG: hypothetical protein IPL71_20550 [Anaerolineales bacterium]|uniref:hypothetical protein n=1 Tax=Candidatus Villigracilis proximus TaxID=3140683 RepID=UPI003134D29E|nr:hypothetical protein [Anaerolineales bacterium]
MNTKILMTSSSLVLGSAGVFALFAPDVLLSALGSAATGTLSMLVQLMGALYFSLALMNWTAKDSTIGGVYARPVSLANFGHFLTGMLVLLRYELSTEMNLSLLTALVVYAIYAVCFYWLVFRSTGVKSSSRT